MRAALLLLVLACGRDERRAADVEPPAPLSRPVHFEADAVSAWVGQELADREAIGAALVVARDGKIVIAKGYGTKAIGTVQPVDADTPFALGSISKQLTCGVVAMLADDGLLSFDDPVAKHVPDVTRAADITLADLGGHTSGYRDYYPLDYVDTRMASAITPDALIAQYARMPLDFEPRARMSYSNTGFVLLARIAERVSSRPWAELLQTKVFAPLAMTTATTVRPATAATGHEAFLLEPPTAAVPEAGDWLFGAADVWASANDLARWDLAIANGTLLSPAATTRITTGRTLTNGKPTSYGCGFYVRTIGNEIVLSHSGWVGGFVTYNAIVPRTRSAVVLLVNDQHVDVGDLHDAVLRLVLEDPTVIPTVAGPPIADVARDFLAQVASGTVDRTRLGDDLSAYLDDHRLARAAATLQALGTPKVTLVSRSERGGLEHATLRVTFPSKTVEASVFRSPDGKLRQFLLTP